MKTEQDLFWLVNKTTAITLTRKKLIPSYFATLWAKSHAGITPFYWKVLEKILDFLWMFLGVALTLGVPIVLEHYNLLNGKDKSAVVITFGLMGFVAIVFMIGHSYFEVFRKAEMNWRRFNSGFQEFARLFYYDNVFPVTAEEFVEKVDKVLVRRAYNQIKEKIKADWHSSYPMRDLYDAAKEFGILKHGDVGYKPYFDRAQKQLDEEEMPLFHQGHKQP